MDFEITLMFKIKNMFLYLIFLSVQMFSELLPKLGIYSCHFVLFKNKLYIKTYFRYNVLGYNSM